MFRQGEVYENPVTGEKAVIRLGTKESGGDRLLVDLELQAGGFGSQLHLHPSIHERWTPISGRIGVYVNGTISIAPLGKTIDIRPGVAHRFWNAGICEAKLTLDIRPGRRYETFIRNMIGLAQDGKTDSRGIPGLLQFAATATEFDDVVHFLKPSRFVQRAVFPLLAQIARLRGYRGSYSEYALRTPSDRIRNHARLHVLKYF